MKILDYEKKNLPQDSSRGSGVLNRVPKKQKKLSQEKDVSTIFYLKLKDVRQDPLRVSQTTTTTKNRIHQNPLEHSKIDRAPTPSMGVNNEPMNPQGVFFV